ncbi:3-deoxy-D-manno-octulosonic acid transferase [Candidatus Pelagibacter sp.]|nr:3-deoxy-D-manno-octulosonic acid transferase [Candidatus Pelagibacter sp.]
MFFFYEILAITFLLFSPIIFAVRIIIGKEDFNRFLEKFCIYKKYNKNQTIWFHGASVGEIMSILPIIKILEKNNKVQKILLTSTTTSSASVVKKIKFRKTEHVYFPIDENYLTNKFLEFWKPKVAIFIDSEIWPNMIKNLKRKDIPIVLINGRITSKSYKRWLRFPNFAKKIFSSITLALPQNKESKLYLSKLGVKNIKIAGNLKYFGEKKTKINSDVKKIIRDRKIFCCASTHDNEEDLISEAHKKVKKSINNLLTVIIPRHVYRTDRIVRLLESKQLNVITRSSRNKISKSTDVYIADTYGEARKFYEISNLCFVGGSLVNHGGQNPLEPVRGKNYIIFGPFIHNFKEVYDLLLNLKIASKVKSLNNVCELIKKKINYNHSRKILKKIDEMGKRVLKNNIYEIDKFI